LIWPDDYINKVICGDCLEVMKGIPDGAIDLVVTDPPYGIGAARYTRGGTQYGNSLARCKSYGVSDWDDATPSPDVFAEMFRVARSAIIFGGIYFQLPPSACWLVWDKDNGSNGYADCELAWTNLSGAVRRLRHKWHGMLQEHMGDKKETRVHPTQKPVPVMQWSIGQAPDDCQIILDPFAGSGTTLVAAKQLGRRYIGIEINPDYCKIAEDRLRQEELFPCSAS
jgi:DNA modification methylase